MGAWIETYRQEGRAETQGSHPTWVRGLKQLSRHNIIKLIAVAPYVGAWIETQKSGQPLTDKHVAPYVGAWIETTMQVDTQVNSNVAPYVGAWIETMPYTMIGNHNSVAPYVGAWIETLYQAYQHQA